MYGTGQWNGVAIVSAVGIDGVRRGFDGEPGFPDAEARALAATCGGVRVWSLYVPNGRTVDSPHFTYKIAWLARAARRHRRRRRRLARDGGVRRLQRGPDRPSTSGTPQPSWARPT